MYDLSNFKWSAVTAKRDVLAELLRLEIKTNTMIYTYGGQVDMRYVKLTGGW